MGLMTNKKGVIMGIANERSIATGIAKALSEEGAELALSHLPDDRGRMEARVKRASEGCNVSLLAPCDVNNDAQVAEFFRKVGEQFGHIDFLVHSVAFAPLEDIRASTLHASRKGFNIAMETSCYSFINTARAASELMTKGGSMLTMTYFGGEKVVAGYNLMGLAKSALECSVKYLAYDLGPKQIRVNSISAGPIKTLAASAVGDFGDMIGMNEAMAPLGRTVTIEEVGKSAAYLLSDYASGTTGENVHVDSGYHVMGSPGRALETWGVRPREAKK